ncbi:MAG: hypothetical protein JWM93_1076 [Frankiales bacterium]|nr:hypothetical protein [Frankiales bacterium]
MKRDVSYQWHLAELMARRGMHNTTDIAPLLAERGLSLSPSQVYRIVTQRPERVSLTLIAALCDIFDCGVDDLITVTAADVRRTPHKAAAAGNVTAISAGRKPVRARIVRD